MSVVDCPLSKAPGVRARLPVDFELLEGLKKAGVDELRLLVDLELLLYLKNPPKPPRLDAAFV